MKSKKSFIAIFLVLIITALSLTGLLTGCEEEAGASFTFAPTAEPTPEPTPGPVIFTDEKVEISFYGVEAQYTFGRNEIAFGVQNNSASAITIQCTALTLDGVSQNEPKIEAGEVAANSFAKINVALTGYTEQKTPATVGAAFTVTAADGTFETYEITLEDSQIQK